MCLVVCPVPPSLPGNRKPLSSLYSHTSGDGDLTILQWPRENSKWELALKCTDFRVYRFPILAVLLQILRSCLGWVGQRFGVRGSGWGGGQFRFSLLSLSKPECQLI